MATYTHLSVDYTHDNRIAQVTMRRPEAHNALNTQLIADLKLTFSELATDRHLHGVVLTGDGPSFSAGADVSMMRQAANFSHEQNVQDALAIADMFQAINTFPCPVVARINGAALGGGVGLVAACDIAIAAEHARFAFSEVKLGIAPSMISPFVLRKIGSSNARVLFVTGERFNAARAREIGLVQQVVTREQLDETVQTVLGELLSGAPQALRVCKALALNVGQMSPEDARRFTAETIARLRAGEEGQEGLSAFLEKRTPNWVH